MVVDIRMLHYKPAQNSVAYRKEPKLIVMSYPGCAVQLQLRWARLDCRWGSGLVHIILMLFGVGLYHDSSESHWRVRENAGYFLRLCVAVLYNHIPLIKRSHMANTGIYAVPSPVLCKMAWLEGVKLLTAILLSTTGFNIGFKYGGFSVKLVD